jgi:chromosome segregation ATPase
MSLQKTMADLQAMVTQQRDALAKETDSRKSLTSALANETALRIAETNKLEEQLENQKDEHHQLMKDLRSKQDMLTKEMSEHAASMKSISEVRNPCNYIQILH